MNVKIILRNSRELQTLTSLHQLHVMLTKLSLQIRKKSFIIVNVPKKLLA